MQAILVTNNEVVSYHSGSIANLVGAIAIDSTMSNTLRALRDTAEAEGRLVNVLWNDGVPSLPVDSRPSLTVTINGQEGGTVQVLVGGSITLGITLDTPADITTVIPVFDRRFLFSFVNGSASKVISAESSGLYTIKSDNSFKVLVPVTIDIVE